MPRITNRLLTSPEQGLPEAQKRNARQNAGIEDFVSSAEATSSQLKLHFKESGTVTFSPVLPQPEPGQEYNVMATNGEGTYGWTEGVLEIRDSSGTKIQPVAGAVQLPPMDQSDWTAEEGTPAAILHKPGIEQAAEGGTTESLVSTGEKYAWNNKVDQVAGKGLSTEDYTTAEQEKLSGIASGAQVNVIETVQLNGTAVTPSGKTVNIQLDKSSVGLGNVDNTSDLDKPISTATQSALDGKAGKATTLAGYGITDAYTKTETGTLLDGKVDTVSGKGLSTNDFTDTDKENATKASIIPANASATSSLTCTAANTFVWAGWEQKDVEVPPVIKKYLGIAYRDYTIGVSLLPDKYTPYSTNIRNFLDNPTYSELKSYQMTESAGTMDQIGIISTTAVLNLWNQNKTFTLETMFHTNNISGSIGWSRRGYSGGGTPLLIKNSSFIVQFDTGNVYIRTISEGSYTNRATFPVYISEYTWHHIAITYDSASKICTAFIDGIKVGSTTITWTHATEESFVTSLGSTVTQVAVYDYVAYDDNFTVPTIPHIYNSEYALKS